MKIILESAEIVDVYNEFISEYGLFDELASFLVYRGEDLENFGFSEDEAKEYQRDNQDK